MKIEIFNKLADLSSRPKSEKFTDDEIKFILNNSDIKEGVAKYCTCKQKIHNGKGVSAVRCFSHLTIGTLKCALWLLQFVICSWVSIRKYINK